MTATCCSELISLVFLSSLPLRLLQFPASFVYLLPLVSVVFLLPPVSFAFLLLPVFELPPPLFVSVAQLTPVSVHAPTPPLLLSSSVLPQPHELASPSLLSCVQLPPQHVDCVPPPLVDGAPPQVSYVAPPLSLP